MKNEAYHYKGGFIYLEPRADGVRYVTKRGDKVVAEGIVKTKSEAKNLAESVLSKPPPKTSQPQPKIEGIQYIKLKHNTYGSKYITLKCSSCKKEERMAEVFFKNTPLKERRCHGCYAIGTLYITKIEQ